MAARFGLDRTAVLSACAAVLSNIVSNVPAVLVFKPVMAHPPDPRHAWLVPAMSSMLAGNLTLLGSAANLIVVERARGEVHISFWEYAKVGVPVTVVTPASARVRSRQARVPAPRYYILRTTKERTGWVTLQESRPDWPARRCFRRRRPRSW
jgi:hypothetical protein